MRYTLYVVFVVTILLYFTFMTNARADTPQAMASPYYKHALLYMPIGADITKITITRDTEFGTNPYYVNFNFQDECFLLVTASRKLALTTVECK